MRRHVIEPRPDWRRRLARLGMEIEAGSSPYWREDAYYTFTEAAIDRLETACIELVGMLERAVEHAVVNDRLAELGIPEPLRRPAAESWRARQPSLYGRLDLRFDGSGPPQLLEYNADTPTALFEASVVQWHWLEERFAERDQWNSIHEGLIEAWRRMRGHLAASARRRLPPGSPLAGSLLSGLPPAPTVAPAAPRVHFACSPEDDDDLLTTAYLQDTAAQAGLDTRFVAISDIGCDGRRFLDMGGDDIRALFKLYPWDWLAREPFFAHLVRLAPVVIEPAWRVVPASKGILAILSELFPGHPSLLPASFATGTIRGPVIRKPLLGREGANMVVNSTAGLTMTEGPYGAMPVIEQAFAPLPAFDGWHPVLGVWIVGGAPRGLGIREDRSLVTGRGASFVPHLIG